MFIFIILNWLLLLPEKAILMLPILPPVLPILPPVLPHPPPVLPHLPPALPHPPPVLPRLRPEDHCLLLRPSLSFIEKNLSLLLEPK